MPQPDESRRMLGAFLRARRAALPPPAAGRRRTPGLRREEVAERGGISTTWYTWLEQGRAIALSAEALARLAAALALTPAERRYLFALAERRDPAPRRAAAPAARSPLQALLGAVAAPAYVLDPLWNGQAWNDAASDLFAPWLASGEANLLRWVFLDPAARGFIDDWPARSRRLLAEFRADIGARVADAPVKALLAGLARDSDSFAPAWNGQAVQDRAGGARTFRHPRRGVLRFEQMTLAPTAHPDHKVVILLPRDATGA